MPVLYAQKRLNILCRFWKDSVLLIFLFLPALGSLRLETFLLGGSICGDPKVNEMDNTFDNTVHLGFCFLP